MTKAEQTFEKIAEMSEEQVAAALAGTAAAGTGAGAYAAKGKAQKAKDLSRYTRSRGYLGVLGSGYDRLMGNPTGADLGLSKGRRAFSHLVPSMSAGLNRNIGMNAASAAHKPLAGAVGSIIGRVGAVEPTARAYSKQSKALNTLSKRLKGGAAGLAALGAGALGVDALTE